MRNKNFTIDDFLELQKIIDTKLHFRDACGGNVIEIDNNDENISKKIIEFFKKRNMEVMFSENMKYVYRIS